MKSYLNILSSIIKYGTRKYPTRSIGNVGQIDGSVATLMLPNMIFNHRMKDGFPLLTTKKMSIRNIAVELEGFIHGITDKSWYQERGCHIWDEWANPESVTGDTKEDRLNSQKQSNDLGPIYGAQWRNFNGAGFDQLKYIVDTLKTNPNDRRMVCSAWNPSQFQSMALLPCHVMFNITTSGNELNLVWLQRSNDFFLGNPYNIASYGLLLTLLAREADMEPGLLTGVFVDCHLYENQISVANEQLKRTPYDLPQLKIKDRSKSIWDWTHEDIELVGYQCHPRLKCEVYV